LIITFITYIHARTMSTPKWLLEWHHIDDLSYLHFFDQPKLRLKKHYDQAPNQADLDKFLTSGDQNGDQWFSLVKAVVTAESKGWKWDKWEPHSKSGQGPHLLIRSAPQNNHWGLAEKHIDLLRKGQEIIVRPDAMIILVATDLFGKTPPPLEEVDYDPDMHLLANNILQPLDDRIMYGITTQDDYATMPSDSELWSGLDPTEALNSGPEMASLYPPLYVIDADQNDGRRQELKRAIASERANPRAGRNERLWKKVDDLGRLIDDAMRIWHYPKQIALDGRVQDPFCSIERTYVASGAGKLIVHVCGFKTPQTNLMQRKKLITPLGTIATDPWRGGNFRGHRTTLLPG